MNQIRKDVIFKIISSVPDNMKPTEYIMRTLNISKGSAYRRLNGLLPFTYDEIVTLAREMNFSVDELIHTDSRKQFIFKFDNYSNDNTSAIILKTLTEYYNTMLTEQKMNKRDIVITTNNLWFVYTFHFDNLFNFFYYKFLQRTDISHLKDKMGDIEIPQSVSDIRNKLVDLMDSMDNTYRTSILDQYIFWNTASEIQYYYRRNLIDNNQLNAIVKDLEDLLNAIEKVIIGNEYNGERNQYFLAERNIYTNSASIKNDLQTYAEIFQNNVCPISCYDQELCSMHRQYLDTHKKQSRLISSSNEQLQIAFFEKQYEYINALAENRDLKVG